MECYKSYYEGPCCYGSSASSVPETRVLQLPPIRGAVLIQSPDFEADEMKHGLKSINHLAANRKREVRKTPNLGHTSLEELTDQEFQLPPSHLRRRSVSCMEDINISLVQGDSPAWLKPKISQRSRRDNHFPQQVPRSPYNRSPSSSDTESPPARQPRYYRRGKGGLKPQRKRGNSLSRLQEKPTGKNTSSWTSGSSRKNSNKYHTVNQKVQQIRTVDNDIPISYGFSLQH